MSKSYLISSSREEFINVIIQDLCKKYEIPDNSTDILLIIPQAHKQSIGIDSTRKLKEWIKVKPYDSPNKLAIIKNSELLTTEAQNSILKLLEEPNKNCYIVLCVENPFSLLPTVLSRCELIQENNFTNVYIRNNFLELSKTEQFKYIEVLLSEKNPLIQKTQTQKFLRDLLSTLESQLVDDYKDATLRENIDLVEQTSIMISGNTPKRLALENLIINMK